MGHDATPLDAARERLREVCGSHSRTESVPVANADGRVLVAPLAAERTVPHYDRAAMDGFAVRAADVAGVGPDTPVALDVVEGAIGDGEAAPVNTGSPIPDGADTVARVERTDRRGEQVLVREAIAAGTDLAPAGEDVDSGEHLFGAGHRLRPSDLALLRAAGHRTVAVAERPRVSVVPTGEELVTPGETPARGEVYETNGLLVARLVERWGGTATYREVVGDDPGTLRAAVGGDTDHDIVITTGGTSVGERDLLADVVAELGEVIVHGVAIKPGHPVGFGVVDGTVVLMLPGYPVSCLVTAVQFLRPALAWLAGTDPDSHPTTRARLAEPLSGKPGKRSFERVVLDAGEDGVPEARPVERRGAGVLSGVALADGWVEIPESVTELPAGESVAVQDWERCP